jgi:HAMP domain-containing protein
MKLAPKFTVIFVVAFGIMLLVAGAVCYGYLQRSARNEVLGQAQLMVEAASAMRSYTDEQIKPIVGVRRATEFHAQWIPFYAATQMFGKLRLKYPAYTYKEATLNPTNPRDRTVDWEADIVNEFRDNPDLKEDVGERDSPEGRSLFLAHPISVEPDCLECHSTPAAAPRAMLVQYGTINGFGWKLHEIVGAQIVSVPAAVASRLTESAIRALATALICFALISLIILNLVLTRLVIRPVSRITVAANQTLDGKSEVADIPVQGNDEIASLGDAFNRLRRSVFHTKNQR